MQLFRPYHLLAGSVLSKTLTVAALILLTLPVFAQEQCGAVFLAPKLSVYGTLKAHFKLNTDYKVLVPEQSQVKNQCGLGTCHLYSLVSLLEQQYNTTNKGKLKISADYLSAKHWLQKSLIVLNNPEDGVKVQLGANILMSRELIQNYGLIPDTAWKGRPDFNSSPLSNRMTEYIENIIARAHWEISLQTDEKIKTKIIEKATAQIKAAFEKQIGVLPETFEFNGFTYTPQSFQKSFFPELSQPVLIVAIDSSRKNPTTLREIRPHFAEVATSIDKVENLARILIDKGINVSLSYDHNSQFVDDDSGLMSISAFEMPKGGGPLSRQQRNYFGVEASGHAVQIVGYDFDPITNKVLKWKIKNSWGEHAGDHGYYHMYTDYFRAFTKSISFFQTDQVEMLTIEAHIPIQLALPF